MCEMHVEHISLFEIVEDWKQPECCLPRSEVKKCKPLSHVWLSAAPWTAAHQTPLSVGFSRQECWNGLPFPSQGIFPTQGPNLGLLHCRRILYHWATRKTSPRTSKPIKVPPRSRKLERKQDKSRKNQGRKKQRLLNLKSREKVQ